MFRKLFGETVEDQLAFLKPRVIVTVVVLGIGLIAGIIGIAFGG